MMRALILLAGVGLLISGSRTGAMGQRADRSSDVRQRGGSPRRTAVTGAPNPAAAPADDAAVVGFMITAAAPKPRYSMDVHPQFQWDGEQQQVGGAISFANDSLLSHVPFVVTLKDRIISGGETQHNLLQVDGYLQPLPSWTFLSRDVTLLLLGLARTKTGIERLGEAEAEVDITAFEDTARSLRLVTSLLGYYDWLKPAGVSTTSGPTAGVSAQLAIHWLRLDGEYDFKSRFAGEYYFLTTATIVVERSGRTVSPYVTIEKHGTYRLGFKVNIPETRQRPSSERR